MPAELVKGAGFAFALSLGQEGRRVLPKQATGGHHLYWPLIPFKHKLDKHNINLHSGDGEERG